MPSMVLTIFIKKPTEGASLAAASSPTFHDPVGWRDQSSSTSLLPEIEPLRRRSRLITFPLTTAPSSTIVAAAGLPA